MGISAQVLADSQSPCGVRLTTLVVEMPRIILAEWNTHRMFSRSSASSRAIPVAKRIAAVRADPFVPTAFGANQRGMSAGTALEGRAAQEARDCWLWAVEEACKRAAEFDAMGVHKQWANRIIEPYSYTKVVTGATEWSNFFHRRISRHAQPEMQETARRVHEVMEESIPRVLQVGEWHLPFIDWDDLVSQNIDPKDFPKISTARCARVSYLTQDGVRDPAKDTQLHDELLANGHMSPFEFAAVVGMSGGRRRTYLPDGSTLVAEGPFIGNYAAPWIQYRKMIKNEHDLPGDEG